VEQRAPPRWAGAPFAHPARSHARGQATAAASSAPTAPGTTPPEVAAPVEHDDSGPPAAVWALIAVAVAAAAGGPSYAGLGSRAAMLIDVFYLGTA
jgi:hypothetical protein